MYLIARDKDNNVDKVYGYVSITNIANYAKGKDPEDTFKWEMGIPFDYTGEIIYLPERNDV